MKKFLVAALIACSCAVPALAASSEDYAANNSACMISFSDSTSTRFLNVNYIRLAQIKNNEDHKVLHISMASNYSNSSTDQIKVSYPSTKEALKALNKLTDKINDCQYSAAMKRAPRGKVQ